MARESVHNATDAALGYYFQGMFALLLLLDAGDEDLVSVETGDDIEVTGGNPRLVQIKHSLKVGATFTEKNDGLWKTLGIWIKVLAQYRGNLVLVTCAKLQEEHPLSALGSDGGADISNALKVLVSEASRVSQAVAGAKAKKESAPYKGRSAACEEFLNLSEQEQLSLLSRITICDSSTNITELEDEVESRLKTYTRSVRSLLARRLLEWWDYRVARSLAGLDGRSIGKEELLDRIEAIATSLAEDNLPDDYSTQSPPMLVDSDSQMFKQIALVDGGENRASRATLARWRAREQRNRWISERIGLADVLRRFDDQLIEHWKDRHGPMQDDCVAMAENEKRNRGRNLLDWTHQDAFDVLPRLRPKWDKAFLVQGTYQDLADKLAVGWHPDYQEVLGTGPAGEEGDETNDD